MSELNNKKALHVATFSGWYRFEQDGKEWKKTKRDLTYWTLTCLSVDSEDPKTIYAGNRALWTLLHERRRRTLAPGQPESAEDDALLDARAERRGHGWDDSLGGLPKQERRLGRVGRGAHSQCRR